MAECKLFSKLVVEGASDETLNGVYYPAGSTIAGSESTIPDVFNVYSKDGAIDSYPRFEVYYVEQFFGTPADPGWPPPSFASKQLYWRLYSSEESASDKSVLDTINAYAPLSPYSCSMVGEWKNEEDNLLFTVTGVPVYDLPIETVELITARFGSVANFLRLRNQGQV